MKKGHWLEKVLVWSVLFGVSPAYGIFQWPLEFGFWVGKTEVMVTVWSPAVSVSAHDCWSQSQTIFPVFNLLLQPRDKADINRMHSRKPDKVLVVARWTMSQYNLIIKHRNELNCDFVRWENVVFTLTQLLFVEIPFFKILYNLFVVKGKKGLHRNATVAVFGVYLHLLFSACVYIKGWNNCFKTRVRKCYRSNIESCLCAFIHYHWKLTVLSKCATQCFSLAFWIQSSHWFVFLS